MKRPKPFKLNLQQYALICAIQLLTEHVQHTKEKKFEVVDQDITYQFRILKGKKKYVKKGKEKN